MAKKNNRPLQNYETVEYFLENALEYDLSSEDNYKVVSKIVATELNIENFDESLITVASKNYRSLKYRSDVSRAKLREDIVSELITLTRLDNDEEIILGTGGAFPQTALKTDKNAYIIIGLPASGKSGIANFIADKVGGYILDSDYAKRKLPEFTALPFGATLVHEESDEIVFGTSKFKSLFQHCIEYGANIVTPKIGSNRDGIITLIDLFRKANYKTHLTLVELDRKKATLRALSRFKHTKRYVPLGLIFDTYGNNPTITYYKITTSLDGKLESCGIISTDVGIGEKPKTIAYSGQNPAKYYNDGKEVKSKKKVNKK